MNEQFWSFREMKKRSFKNQQRNTKMENRLNDVEKINAFLLNERFFLLKFWKEMFLFTERTIFSNKLFKEQLHVFSP